MAQTSGSRIVEETTLESGHLEHLAARIETSDDRSSLEVRTPVTDEAIGAIPACTRDDVAGAVERARSAQNNWEQVTVDERAAIIQRFGDLVLKRREELLDVVQLETGKARHHAVEEILDVPLTCSYYAANGPSILADADRSGAIPLASDATVTYDPVGVVGVISPWNYPLTLAMTDAIPALLAGVEWR